MTLAFCKNVSTIRRWFRYCSTVFEKKMISSRYTSAACHFTEEKLICIALSDVAGTLFNTIGMLAN